MLSSTSRWLIKLNEIGVFNQTKRTLKKEIRKKLKEKTSPKNLALEYFDYFYGASYGNEWNRMRLAMLTGNKKVALINNYSNRLETIKQMESLAAFDMFDFSLKYKIQSIEEQKDSSPNENYTNKREQMDVLSKLKIPFYLKTFCFDNGDTRQFPSPKLSDNNVLNYYCLDGASLLPILALDIQKDDSILDLCASPGGKTLAMLQTMLPKKITCRDISASRLDRLKRMLKSYLREDDLNKLVQIELNIQELGFQQSNEYFDKVLVDVPCTNDRHSLFQDYNNIFSKYRTEERTDLPKKQAELLKQAIESCKMNGIVVYSTCSLSPIQNEGVLNSVIEHFDKQNFKFQLKIQQMDYLKLNLDYFFSFSNSSKHGLLVAPQINKNFGPFYLCKILKLSK